MEDMSGEWRAKMDGRRQTSYHLFELREFNLKKFSLQGCLGGLIG